MLLETEIKKVKPIILVNILPFGLHEEDGKTFFRFSLCIDSCSNYKENEEPIYENLRKFYLRYGLQEGEIESLHNRIQSRIQLNIGNKFYKTCFPSFSDSKLYWEKLIFVNPAITINTIYNEEEVKYGTYTPNAIDKKGVVTFLDKNTRDPNAIFQRLVSDQTKGKDGLEKLVEDLAEQSESIQISLDKVSDNLLGISNFSESQNINQTNIMYGPATEIAETKTIKLKHDKTGYSWHRIADTFSFISSNPILQRLFGTTIDFIVDLDDIRKIGNNAEEFLFDLKIKDKAFDDLLPDVHWEYLTTPMYYKKIKEKGEIILVDRGNKKWIDDSFSAVNYDAVAKLQSLNSINDKIKDFVAEIKKTKTESERQRIYKEITRVDSAALTRGMNIHGKDIPKQIDEFLNPPQPAEGAKEAPSSKLEEIALTKGHKFGILNKDGSKIISLGARKAELYIEKTPGKFTPLKLPDELMFQEFACNTDTGMHALVEERDKNGNLSGKVEQKLVIDTALLTWSGENIGMPGVFSNQEDETNFKSRDDEGSLSDSTEIVIKNFLKIFKEDYFPKSVNYTGGLKFIDEKINISEDQGKFLTLKYNFTENAKLLLGNYYTVFMVPEYKNGWGLSFNGRKNKAGKAYELGLIDLPISTDEKIDFQFKRNEPVKPVALFLEHPLVEKGHTSKDRDGESLTHLVIRNYCPGDSSNERSTSQYSARYILPPQISFEHAFWHNKIFEIHQKYGPKESYKWYKKYHFPVIEGNLKEGSSTERYTYEEAIEGSTRMRDYTIDEWYIPDWSWLKNKEIINYLPDPLSKGFRLEFYKDKDRLIKAKEYEKYEQLEFYFTGNYPKINAWKIILEDLEKPLVKYDLGDEEISVSVEKGSELYLTIRTILHDSYEDKMETYGNYNDYTKYGNNELLTPPLELSMVHAMQRPLINPRFITTLKCKKPLDKAELYLTNTIHLEQLDINKDASGIVHYIEGTVPTGNLELYAKWEEYADDPNHLITDEWTPDSPINKIDITQFEPGGKGFSAATFETSIDISKKLSDMEGTLNKIQNESNDSKNYIVDISHTYDIKETKFLEKWYWIKNKSKFTSYYPPYWGTKEPSDENTRDEESKEYFNRTSTEPYLVKILNSKKPKYPELAAKNITLLSVKEDITKDNSITRKSSMNRLRFYFERGRLSSGKGERIGFVLNEPKSKYNDMMFSRNLISKVGKDIVTDSVKPYDGLYRNSDVALTKANFTIHDPSDITDKNRHKASDLESFSPLYVEDLGIMTFKPKFDRKINLWFLDIELDINDQFGNELHCPFLQFGLVHYQENSFNYNGPKDADFSLDCRISDVNMSGFAYLLPSRLIYLNYVPSLNRLEIKIDLDKSSLAANNMSKFIAIVQYSDDNIRWIDSKDNIHLINNPYDKKNLSFVLPGKFKDNYIARRLLLLEVERYSATPLPPVTSIKLEDFLEDKENRIISINTFKF